MGYTNYIYRPKTLSKIAWAKIIRDTKIVLDHIENNLNIPLANSQGDKDSRPEIDDNLIAFNGAESYESVYIERIKKPREWETKDNKELKLDFVKTNRLPYDLAVKITFLIIKHHVPKVAISLTGTDEDWIDARITCFNVLGYGFHEEFAE